MGSPSSEKFPLRITANQRINVNQRGQAIVIYSLTRGREGAYGRSMVAYLARTISGCKGTEVSKHFQRSLMRMSQVIIQFENKLHKDEPLRKPIEELKEALIKKGKKKYFITIA